MYMLLSAARKTGLEQTNCSNRYFYILYLSSSSTQPGLIQLQTHCFILYLAYFHFFWFDLVTDVDPGTWVFIPWWRMCHPQPPSFALGNTLLRDTKSSFLAWESPSFITNSTCCLKWFGISESASTGWSDIVSRVVPPFCFQNATLTQSSEWVKACVHKFLVDIQLTTHLQ